MALTEEVYVIGSGGDYANFAAYVAAKAGDLVSQDVYHTLKAKAGNLGVLDVSSGFTTDATRCINVIPNVASEQFDVDDAADPDSAVAGSPSIDVTGKAVICGDEHINISGLLMISEDASETGVSMSNSSPATFEDCLLVQRSTNAACVAKGFFTGTGFTGHIMNCISVVENSGSGFASAKNFDVDCSTVREAVINCTSIGLWDSANLIGVNLKNSAKAINVLSANNASTGKCYGTDSNENAVVKNCGATDTSITDNFEAENIEDCTESLTYADLFDTNIGKLAGNSPARWLGVLPATSGGAVDAFGTDRIRYDLGYHQTPAVSSKDVETVFRDVGSLVATYNDYHETVRGLINAGKIDRADRFRNTADRLEMLYVFQGRDSQAINQLASWLTNVIQSVTDYLQDYVKELVLSVDSAVLDILDELDYWLSVNSDSVNAIEQDTVVSYRVTYATGMTLDSVAITELLKPQRITIECTSNSTNGSEVWTIKGSVSGTFSGMAVTNTAYESADGELGFTINPGSPSAWDSGHGTYSVNDVVSYQDGYYICIVEHTAAEGKEPTNTTYWAAYIQEGDKIYLDVTADDVALFQMFFRDNFSYIFGNTNAAGAETILDSWAE